MQKSSKEISEFKYDEIIERTNPIEKEVQLLY